MSTQSAHGLHRPQWTFGDHLRKVRRETRLNQVRFAEVLDLHPDTYSAYETGRNEPSISKAREIALRIELAFRVPAEWVLGTYDNGPRPGVSQDGDLLRPRPDSNGHATGREFAQVINMNDWREAS